jgi:hypothetical protein
MGETDPMKHLAAVAVLSLVAACGLSSDPEERSGAGDVVRELLVAVDAGSCPEVKRLVVTPDAIDCEQIQDLGGSYSQEGVDLDELSVSVGEIVDGSATVTADLGAGQEHEQWQVERLDGSWKVLFDSVE